MPIKAPKAWEINVKVNHEFVKHWIDISKLRISTTNGCVHIKGDLVFQGDKVDEKSIVAVSSQLKNTERGIKAISGVKDVKFDFSTWGKTSGIWQPKRGKK